MALPRFSFPAPGGRRSATPPAAGVLMPGDERFLHGSRQAELVEPMPRALWALYLLCVIVVVTGVWAAQARVDAGDGDPFYLAKVITARFYADHLLTQAEGLASTVVDGSGAVLAMPLDQY